MVRAGAKVALTDISQEWLDQSINEVREIGGDDCDIDIVSDVTDPQACPDAVDTAITQLLFTCKCQFEKILKATDRSFRGYCPCS